LLTQGNISWLGLVFPARRILYAPKIPHAILPANKFEVKQQAIACLALISINEVSFLRDIRFIYYRGVIVL